MWICYRIWPVPTHVAAHYTVSIRLAKLPRAGSWERKVEIKRKRSRACRAHDILWPLIWWHGCLKEAGSFVTGQTHLAQELETLKEDPGRWTSCKRSCCPAAVEWTVSVSEKAERQSIFSNLPKVKVQLCITSKLQILCEIISDDTS